MFNRKKRNAFIRKVLLILLSIAAVIVMLAVVFVYTIEENGAVPEGSEQPGVATPETF